MEWIPKPWGETACLFRDRNTEHWIARVLAGGFSSRHYHQYKDNRLTSLSAIVVVTQWHVRRVRRSILQPGDYVDVPAGVLHRFEVIRGGDVWECYRGRDCRPDDIVRLDANGIKPTGISSCVRVTGLALR